MLYHNTYSQSLRKRIHMATRFIFIRCAWYWIPHRKRIGLRADSRFRRPCVCFGWRQEPQANITHMDDLLAQSPPRTAGKWCKTCAELLPATHASVHRNIDIFEPSSRSVQFPTQLINYTSNPSRILHSQSSRQQRSFLSETGMWGTKMM